MARRKVNRAAGAGAALAVLVASASFACAQEAACPFDKQKPMLVVQMFFGQSIKGRGPVTAEEWRSFLAQTVTIDLPSGFTVYDAYGQWRDPATHRIGREKTKVIEAAIDDTPAARAQIVTVTQAYAARFSQRSVGIVSQVQCGVF